MHTQSLLYEHSIIRQALLSAVYAARPQQGRSLASGIFHSDHLCGCMLFGQFWLAALPRVKANDTSMHGNLFCCCFNAVIGMIPMNLQHVVNVNILSCHGIPGQESIMKSCQMYSNALGSLLRVTTVTVVQTLTSSFPCRALFRCWLLCYQLIIQLK